MNILSESLIGLIILVSIALESLILVRRKTIPVILCDQLIIGFIVFKIFGKITLIYTGALVIFLMFIKYKTHINEDIADFDFTDRIFSISAPINKLMKPKNLVMGRILPVNVHEIKYNMKAVELDDTILSGGMLITGSTGSGKTTTLKTIIKQRIDEGRPVVFFDYKGEEEILDEIKVYAENAGLPYYEFSSRDCTFTYDPFINLDETGKIEALMNTRRWSVSGEDEHYKTSMQLCIQNLVRAYDDYRIHNNESCNYIVGLYKYSKTYKPQSNERDGFNNLIKSLEILLSSKAKLLFGDDPTFTFEREEPFVICFSFTSANKALANNISSFTYTDIMDRGTRNHYKQKLMLCIDEFGTLEASTVIKDLLEKGRSGGCQTIFSVLDVNQIAMTSGEFFVNAILGTINTCIIHAGATQVTANLLGGVQKYDKDFDIMSLRKPYKGRKPTVLFITKYSLLNKKNNQEVFRLIPYTKVLKTSKNIKDLINNKDEEIEANFSNYNNDTDDTEIITSDETKVEHTVIPIEELDLSLPISNIEDYL